MQDFEPAFTKTLASETRTKRVMVTRGTERCSKEDWRRNWEAEATGKWNERLSSLFVWRQVCTRVSFYNQLGSRWYFGDIVCMATILVADLLAGCFFWSSQTCGYWANAAAVVPAVVLLLLMYGCFGCRFELEICMELVDVCMWNIWY